MAPGGRGTGGLNSDHADVRLDPLGRGGDPGNQSAAADRYHQCVGIGQIGHDLQTDCALSGHDQLMIEGRHVEHLPVLLHLPGQDCGLVVVDAVQPDLRAVIASGQDLGNRRVLRHHNQ
jgi:hypothetical protein